MVLEFLLHVVLCSAICVFIHYVFHRTVDEKNHKHEHNIDYDKLADALIHTVTKNHIENIISEIESYNITKEEVKNKFIKGI